MQYTTNVFLVVITLFKWLSVAMFSILHPFYVSVTELNHNTADKTLEITCKIYSDDFEKTLSQQYGSLISVTNPKNKELLQIQMTTYIQKHLLLKIDGKSASFTLLGYEIEGDALFCFFQCNNIATVKKIEISNSLLHDFNKNQANIIHVSVNGDRESIKLDYPKTSVSFSF